MAPFPEHPLPYNTGWNIEGVHFDQKSCRQANIEDEFLIQYCSLTRILQGVGGAVKVHDGVMGNINQFLLCHNTSIKASVSSEIETQGRSLKEWHMAITSKFEKGDESRNLLELALAVSFLHEKCQREQEVTTQELDEVWKLVRDSLNSSLSFTVSRSAQGFLSVPLSSLMKAGNIDELYRLHVWLPDKSRGNPEFAIHSHQCFGKSWVLAGEGKDNSYEVHPVNDPSVATHAQYRVAWNDTKHGAHDTNYKIHQASSVVENTKTLMCATPKRSARHTVGMSYTVAAAAYHTSIVAPDILHATIFVFDSNRGFEKDAGVLGPKNGVSFCQERCPGNVTPSELADKVHRVRVWEKLVSKGKDHVEQSDMESARKYFDEALSYLEGCSCFPNATRYKHIVNGYRANTFARFGRHDQAARILEDAIKGLGPCLERVDLSNMLANLYLGMNRLEDAKEACEVQYSTAQDLKADKLICRSVGALAMANYKLFLKNKDNNLLQTAIVQLHQRVITAEKLKKDATEITNPITRDDETKYALTRLAIGLARLSICYESSGDSSTAVTFALNSLRTAIALKNPFVIAMSRYFYGRGLLRQGRHKDALMQFNPPKTYTPAMTLCMNPSEENREYLQEVIDAGADMDLIDHHGYTALDYAVYSRSSQMEKQVLNAMQQKFQSPQFVESRISQQHHEAKVRRCYREIFQDQLRPLLLQASRRSRLENTMAKLRNTYAQALQMGDFSTMLDKLRFVKYLDFVNFGSLRNTSDGAKVQHFMAPSTGRVCSEQGDLFIIFISYRWIHKDDVTMIASPDDQSQTQYKRMVRAIEEFLRKHPYVKREGLAIWVDYACIDQENPSPGVSTLPIIISQCDAVISLVDEMYYTRAWCSVEISMIQQLKKSYNIHLWYEHICIPHNDGAVDRGYVEEILREGSVDRHMTLAAKDLTYESDRPKILFLERQSKLLGRATDIQ